MCLADMFLLFMLTFNYNDSFPLLFGDFGCLIFFFELFCLLSYSVTFLCEEIPEYGVEGGDKL